MNRLYKAPRHCRMKTPMFFALLCILLSSNVRAQTATPCYKPMTGTGVVATPVQGGGLCLACTFVQNPSAVTDSDPNNFSEYNTTLGLASGSGVSVRDTLSSYTAGSYAGYVIDFSNDVLSAGLFSSFQLQTYLNGTLQETKTTSNGVSATLLSGAPGKLYLSFKTTLPFNEVRLTFSSLLGAINNMRVYYAMAFDGNCGYTDNNGICYDQIGGPGSVVNFNGGLVSALVTLASPAALTDGNKNTAATLTLPAGVSLLSTPPFVGVKDLETVYPAGTRAGFVIGYSSSLLSADVLNTFGLQTYLHGELQENIQAGGPASLLKLSALSTLGSDRKELSFVTTKPYNEVRLVVAQPANVNVGSINIYYAFESGAGCTDCKQALISTAPPPYTGSVSAANTGTGGLLCLSSAAGTPNLTDASLTNAATFNTTLGIGCNASFSVKNNGTDFPAGTFAGFAMSRQGGLLGVGLLNAITINLYRNGGATPVASNTGASLLGAGLLTGTDSVGFFGFKSTVAFDEIQININAGLLSLGLGGTYNVHYAYVVRDDDNDGSADCNDVCGTSGADSLDTDNDGIPDPCDACSNTLAFKSPVQDSDHDGVSDACDADSDNDGIADATEDANGNGNPLDDDRDGDGIPNFQDLDSDNDGINDIEEAGFGTATLALIDANNDGVIDASLPKGNNGMANLLENADNATAHNIHTIRNSDGDGAADFLDLDSDNDGVNDIQEAGFTGIADADNDGMVDGPDTDRDGINNSADGNPATYADATGSPAPRDRDLDGVPDYRDLDSDNDGINDVRESGTFADADGNGMVDGPDSDGDGIVDAADGKNGTQGDAGAPVLPDTDSDGVADMLDLDSDNDGLNDVRESGLAASADANNDGLVDGVDNDGDGIRAIADGNDGVFGDVSDPASFDKDNDGVPDARDLDSDNDGINDLRESGQPGLQDADNDGIVDGPDADGDGIRDSADTDDNLFGETGDTPSRDTDGDGVPDANDLDSDNDTISDLVESGQPLADEDNNGVADGPDTDGDGIVDNGDGAPNTFGDLNDPVPADNDNDGNPDYNDLDSNPAPGLDIDDNHYTDLDPDQDGKVDNPVDPDKDGVPNNGGLDSDPDEFGGLGKQTNLSIRVMLQGALFFTNNGLMRDNLRTMGLIPLTSPYTSSLGAKFAHHGHATVEQTTTAVLNANAGTGNAIVDWVLIEFRSAASATTIVQTVSGLLQRDGDIVLGSGAPFRIALPEGSYYVSIKHRNHLGLMTSAPVLVANTNATVDFITATAADLYNAAGFDGNERMTFAGIPSMWAGNANMDYRTTYEDTDNDREELLDQVLNHPGNVDHLNSYANAIGYYTGDINMNGKASYEGAQNDRTALLNVIMNAPLNTSQLNSFLLVVEQLP